MHGGAQAPAADAPRERRQRHGRARPEGRLAVGRPEPADGAFPGCQPIVGRPPPNGAGNGCRPEPFDC